MDLDLITILAQEFYANAAKRDSDAPPDVDVDDLTMLSVADRKQLKDWGTAEEVVGNPPDWVAEPAKWKRAKKAIKPYWKKYKSPYSVIADLYLGNFEGKIKKKRKGKKKS
jgi:hypothetical protein